MCFGMRSGMALRYVPRYVLRYVLRKEVFRIEANECWIDWNIELVGVDRLGRGLSRKGSISSFMPLAYHMWSK